MISIVVYVHNDAHIIEDFLLSLDKLLLDKFEHFEYVFVDDYSSDSSSEVIRNIAPGLNGRSSLIRLTRRHFVESAILAGTDKCIGDYIFELDTVNIDYDIKLLIQMYEKAMEGYDIVGAHPDIKSGFFRRLFFWIVNKYSFLNLSPVPEKLRLISRRALNSILEITERSRFRKGLYSFTGYSNTVIKYNTANKSKSQINTKWDKEIISGLDILVSFTNIAPAIAIFMTIVFFLFAVGSSCYAFYSYLYLDSPWGWPSLLAFLCVLFAGVFFVLAMLSILVTKILAEVLSRPLYTFNSIEEFSGQSN